MSFSTDHPVRTRFAPSPKGFLHIGWYRLLIFSWLVAKHQGGQFLLRVEDTDQQRIVPGVIEDLMESLHWLGIDFDEGPGIGGSFGPYYQSQRLQIYAEFALQLLASGHAYRCFCPKERLDILYAEQMVQHLPTTRYDRRCRQLTSDEIESRLALGESFTIRLKVPLEGVTRVVDVLRGESTFKNNMLEDSILLKADGYPTYHLACVVDDHLMQISHVLRGSASLSSAALHKMIYDALGWQWPLTAHIPSILGPDSKQLSRSHGAQSMLVYRDQGYLPEAIINYLVLLGWSLDDKTEVFSLAELQAAFSLDRLNRSDATFDEKRMKWMNGVYIRKLELDDLVMLALPYLQRREDDGGLPDNVVRPLDRIYLKRVLGLAQARIKLLSEVPYLTAFFFVDDLTYPMELLIGKSMSRVQTFQALCAVLSRVTDFTQWESSSLEEALRLLAKDLRLKTGLLFMSIRVTLTGRTETPSLFDTMEVLGQDRTLHRLRTAIFLLERAS